MASTDLYQAYTDFVAEVTNVSRHYRTGLQVLSESEFNTVVDQLAESVEGARLLEQIRRGFQASCQETRVRFERAIGISTRRAA